MEWTLRKAVQMAVATEQNGIKFYEALAAKFADDPEVGEIFARLAKDEKIHEAQFKKIAEQTPEGEISQDDDQFAYLRAMSMSRFFAGETYNDLTNVETAEDALFEALEFEKSTKAYYDAMTHFVGKAPQLEAIIAEEKKHITALMKVVLTGARFRGLADRWS